MNKYRIYALSASTPVATFDVTANTVPLDLSDELAELIRRDNTVLINRVGVDGGRPITETTLYWVEDKLNPNTDTLNEGAELTAGDVTVTVSNGGRFKIGTIFRFDERGKQELLRVTNVSGNNLTVERGHGGTSGETHADSGTISIIAHTRQEGQSMTEDDTQERTSRYNYPMIWQAGINISYTRQAINYAGIPSEFAHQTAYRLKENMRSLDNAFINSVRSASAGSDTDYRSSGGLMEFAALISGGNATTSAATLAESVVNTSNKDIWDDGGLADFFALGGALKQKVSTFDQAYRRSDFDSRVAGFTVERFITDLGNEMEVIVDPWVISSEYFMGELAKCFIRPMQNDAMRVEQLAKQGRALLAQITGQYGFEFHNGDLAFAYRSNLI